MYEPISVSEFRSGTKEVLDRSDRGALPIVQRRGSRPLALIPLEELAETLARFEFKPEVFTDAEDGSTAVWLPELEIYGQGSDLEAAIEDLVLEVELYLEVWETEDLTSAPNHAHRLGWVRRLQTCAGDRVLVRELLDSPPSPR